MTVPPAQVLRCAFGVAVLALVSVSHAQAQRLADLELGFGGALVADAWNPLRLVLRDVGPVELEVVIDQGTLRTGAIPLVYRASVRGGSGLSVFDDELYVPTWRSLAWTVRAGDVLVASGSLPRADGERRAVDLIVSASPGAMRTLLDGGARAIDVPPDRLLPRTAAYDGIRSVLVVGGTELPRADALLAAAAAGAVVVLDAAAIAAPALAPLAPETGAWRRVGAGWIVTEEALAGGSATLEAVRFDHPSLISAVAGTTRLQPPGTVGGVTLLFGAGAYALAVLVLLRFGGVPGVAAVALVALAASVVAWATLRPPSPTFSEVRDVVVGGGGLGQRWRVHEVVSLPAAQVRIDAPARPAVPAPLVTGPEGSSFDVARWRSRQLVERPTVVQAVLRWQEDGTLFNDTARGLHEVHVKGGGSLGAVPARSVAAEPGSDPAPPSATARSLLDVLPSGAALGTDGSVWYVALALEPALGRGGGAEVGR